MLILNVFFQGEGRKMNIKVKKWILEIVEAIDGLFDKVSCA